MAEKPKPIEVILDGNQNVICDPPLKEVQPGNTIRWFSRFGDFAVEFSEDRKENPFADTKQKFRAAKDDTNGSVSTQVLPDAIRERPYKPKVTLVLPGTGAIKQGTGDIKIVRGT